MSVNRRNVLGGLAAATMLPSGMLKADEQAPASFPNSSGSGRPGLKAPNLACDSHIHIIDPRFKPAEEGASQIPGATASDYRAIQRRIGTTRVVAVNSSYSEDNASLVNAVRVLARAKGIAVVHHVSEAELRRLDF